MSDFIAKVSAELDTSKIEQQINDIGKGKTVKLNVDAGNAQSNINKVNTAMQSSKRTASSFGETLKKSLNIGSAAAITAKSIHLINNAAKDAVKAVKDIDGAITNLRMATGDSYSEVEKLVKSYNQLGQAMGATTTEVASSADAWLRQGNTIKQTNTLIKDSMILSKVGQLDSADATKYLTSAMKGYKVAIQDVSKIVDKLTAVDLVSATDAGGLAEAMSRTAVTASDAGVSMDKLVGYLATVGEVTQKSMSSIGESFKTIFTRMSDIKSEKLKLIDEDGTTETLSDVELTLKNVGIDLRETVNEYNNYSDVLDNLAAKWDSLSEVQQNALAKAFAGTRQQENFRVLMENYDSAKQYMDTAMNSAGTAEQKFAAYADSIEAKTKSLQAAFEALSVDTFSTDMVGNIIDATKAVVSFLDETNLLKGTLSGLAVGAAVKGFTSVASGISSAAMKMSQFNAALKLVKAGNIGEQQIQQLAVMTSTLSDSQLKAVLSSQALSAEQRIAILTAQGMSTAEAQAAVSSMGLATSQGVATASTLTLSGALKGLWATLLANPFILIIAGVTAAATAFYSYNEAMEESVDAARTAATTYQESSDSIQSQIDRIRELREQLANGTLSEMESYQAKQELLSIQQQLSESYGEQAAGIDLLNGKIDEQILKVQALSKEKASQYLNENAAAIAKAEKEMTKTLGGDGGWFSEAGEFLGTFADNQSEASEKVKEIVNKYSENLKLDDMGDNTFRIRFVGDATEASTVLNSVMTDLRNAKSEIGDEPIFDELFENSGYILEDANEILEEYQSIYETAQKARLVEDDSLFSFEGKEGTATKWLNDYAEAVEKYNNALASGEGIAEAKNNFKAIDNAIQALLKNEDFAQYASMFEDVREQLNETSAASEEFIQSVNGADVSDASASIKEYSDSLKELNMTDTQFKDAFFFDTTNAKEGTEAVKALVQAAQDMGLVSENVDDAGIQGFVDTLVSAGVLIQDTVPESVDVAKGSLEEFYQVLNNSEDGNFKERLGNYTDQLDTLKEALSDFNANELGDADIVELMQEFPQLTQYTDNLGVGIQSLIDDLLGLSSEGEDATGVMALFDEQITALGDNTEGAEAMKTLREQILKLYDTANQGFSFDITAEIGNIDNLFGAMSESFSGTGLTTESMDYIKKMFSGLEGYDPSVLFEHTANGIHLNANALRELEAQYESTKKVALQNELSDLKQEYNDTKNELSKLTAGTDAYNQKASELAGIEAQIQDVSTLATQYEGLTSAYNKWILSQSSGEEGDMYDSMRDNMEDYKKLYEEGLIGTNAFRSFTDLLSSEDLSTASTDEVTAAYERLSKTIEGTSYSAMDFLAEGSNGVLNFLNATQELNSEWVHMNEDGSWDINFGVGGDQEVADALGIDVEYLQSILRKLSDYGFDINLDYAHTSVEELQSKIEKTESALKEMGEEPVDIDVNAEDIDSEIDNAKEKIDEIKDSEISPEVKTAQLADAEAKLDVLIRKKIEASQPSFMSIDVSQADTNVQGALQLLQNYQNAVNNLNMLELKGADTSEIEAAKGEVDELAGQLASLDGETKVSIGLEKDATVDDITAAIAADAITIPVDGDTTNIVEKIEGINGKDIEVSVNVSGTDDVNGLNDAIENLKGKTVEVKAKVDGTGLVNNLTSAIDKVTGKIVSVIANVFGTSAVNTLKSAIDKVQSKTVTVTSVTKQTAGVHGTAHAHGTAKANGDWGTKESGVALMGEQKPELIVRGSEYFTVGDDSAGFYPYKKGDIIFNADQTEQIFKYGKIKHGKKRGKTFATGTAFSRGSGSITNNGTTVTVGNVSGGGGGGGSTGGGSKGSSSSKKTAADKFSDWLSNLFNFAEIRLKRLNRLTEKWTNKAEKAVRYSYNQTAKNSTIDKQYSNKASYTKKAITATGNEITGNEKAITTYQKMLKKIKSKGGLSAKTVKKITDDTINGTFAIETYKADSKQRKAIEAYQEYYEKVLDCQDAISDLTESQKDLYDQFYNIPIEQATAKVEKYENAITRLNAAMSATSGGSKVYLKQVVKDAQSAYNSAEVTVTQTQEAYNSAKTKQNQAQNTFNSTQKTMSKTKGLSKSQKSAVKSGKAIDTKGLKGKALKNANAYNKALAALNNAKTATASAKQSNSLAKANKQSASSALDEAKTIQAKYANLPDYEYQNYLLDQETKQKKNVNTAQQAALKTANKNLSDTEKAKTNADNLKAKNKKSVDTKSSAILKNYSKSLTSAQKSALKSGKEVSTNGLKGKALKAVKEYNKAVQTYNKSVDSATDATTKYNSAVEAQATADQNAAEAQAEYTQAIQENAKAKFDNVATSFESKQSTTEAEISKLNTQLSYRASMGYSQTSDNQKNVYNSAISENQSLLASQREELEALKKTYADNVANMSEQDVNSAQAQITALEESILSTQGTIADLQTELDKIEVKKLEIAMDRLKSNADSLQDVMSLKEAKGLSVAVSDYNSLIDNSTEQVANLQAQNTLLEKQLENYSENSEKYQELQQQIESNEDAIRDAVQSQVEWNNAIAELPYTVLENALDLLDTIASNNKSLIDLKSSKGMELSESDYMLQLQDNNNQISKLEDERRQALIDYQHALADPEGVYGGKSADEWHKKYLELGTEINNVLSDNEELKDSLRDDVYWREFEKAHTIAERLQDILKGIADLISDDMIFDKDKNLTKYGVAYVANLVKQYENSRSEIKNYSDDIKNLNKLYLEGQYTETEYNEKLSELQKGLLDSASAMKDYTDSIIDMYKEMAQAELDSLFELIDARNDALNAKKEYYDYDKTIKSKTKDIQALQAQIAALEGIDSLEAKAKRATLEAELTEQQEDLNDTINDHMFDLSQDALSDLKDVLQDSFDDKWDNISANLGEITNLMTAANSLTTSSADTINNTLNELLRYYGIDPVKTGIKNVAGYASGTHGTKDDEIVWVNELGTELMIPPSNNAILAGVKKGTGIVPADLTENLFEWGELNPNRFINEEMRKLNSGQVSGQLGNVVNNNQHYDNLFTVEGNVDSTVISDMKKFAQQFYEGSYRYTVKEIVKDARLGGIKV